MRNTRGITAKTVVIERAILMAFDSSVQTYKRTCAIKRMMPPMKENIPAIYGEEGGPTAVTGYSQCHVTQVNKGLLS